MKGLISVIVPVYNVEKYLSQCIESLINQTYANLEILLIDDGSTDKSGKLCDKYAKKDNRITVIHKKNGGSASAKNEGLNCAKGEYLAFVDSDDFVEIDAYQYMVSQLEKEKADIIQCSFRDVFVNEQIDRIINESERSFDSSEYLRQYTMDWTCGLLWDKLYKRNLFKDIRFEEGHIIDDEFFTYQGVMNAKKIIRSYKIVYNYRKRKSSVMMLETSRQKIVWDKLEYLNMRKEKVISKYPELQSIFELNYISMMFILADDKGITEESFQEIKRMLKRYLQGEKAFKISLRMKFQIYKLIYLNPKKKINSNLVRREDVNWDSYFE